MVVPVSGVRGSLVLGSITLQTNNYLSVSGFAASSELGTVTVIGVWSIPDIDTNNWVTSAIGSNVWTDATVGQNSWVGIPSSVNAWAEIPSQSNSWAVQ